MPNLKDLLVALDHAPHEPQAKDNPYGIGHMLHLGREVKCIGTLDSDGNLIPDSRHLVGTMTAVPDKDSAGNPVDCIPTERADEATFEWTQTNFDLNNPVCTGCGQPVTM